jgi:F-type H+-transporting ATPase subunit epsilon
MNRLPLRVVTPEKIAWEGYVDSLTVPAWEGSLGILPGHAPLLAQLREGVARARSGDEERLLAISGGFVEVFDGKASLFAETAELAEEIDAERARQAAERAKKALKSPAADVSDEQAAAALRRAMVRLRVAELSRPRGARKEVRTS